MILKQRAALERPMLQVIPSQFRVPERCLAADVDCHFTHGILWESLEMFLNDYMLIEDLLDVTSEFRELGIFFS